MTDDLARKMYLAEIATVREHLGEQQQAAVPNETDEQRADREETERNHARGDHTHCGVQCEAIVPTDHLRNMLLYRALPGAKGALAELERRAADAGGFELRGDTEIRAAALREAAHRLYTALFPAVYADMGQKAAEGVNRAVSELRRMADETAATETQADNATLLELVRDFLDPDPCTFDHHGYCQAHGYLGGEPMSCPHGRATKLLAELEQPAAGARHDGAQR